MNARLDLFASKLAGSFYQHILAAEGVLAQADLPKATREMVRLRASQINGCGFCTDMHFKEAVAAGESPERMNMVAAWREATVFTPAERAALDLAEQGTRVADAAEGVTDEAWVEAAEHYDEEQLTALIGEIALINAFNRINAINRTPAGSYTPGQFG
ncbi:carboxymuconolactone decarboxylase family protein [Nocardiopsis coralliicola]